MSEPLVSVCIPAFNAGQYIGPCLESILGQSAADLEVVVSDNCSEDDTVAAIQRLNDPRIRLFRQETNKGSRENVNFAIAQARGTYIKTFCADDVMLPGLLQEQAAILAERPYVKLVTCDHLGSSDDLTPLRLGRMQHGVKRGVDAVAEALDSLENLLGGPSNFMWRRRDTGDSLYDRGLRYLSDFDFAAQILRTGFLAGTNKPGYLYRQHPGNETSVVCTGELRISEWAEMYLKWDGRSFYSANYLLKQGLQPELAGRLRRVLKSRSSRRTRLKQALLWHLWVGVLREDWRRLPVS